MDKGQKKVYPEIDNPNFKGSLWKIYFYEFCEI